MKRLIKMLIVALRPVLIPFLSVFFDRRFLRGKHFDDGFGGYVWAVRSIWLNSILRIGKRYPWPSGITCHISNPKNIHFHPDDLNNFQAPGTYFQNFSGHIHLGRGTYIAPNVGIITANHDAGDLDRHSPGEDVVIGDGCWIGMNSVILPGVVLGPRTVVAAGAVVTKSFHQGDQTIAGIPARTMPVS